MPMRILKWKNRLEKLCRICKLHAQNLQFFWRRILTTRHSIHNTCHRHNVLYMHNKHKLSDNSTERCKDTSRSVDGESFQEVLLHRHIGLVDFLPAARSISTIDIRCTHPHSAGLYSDTYIGYLCNNAATFEAKMSLLVIFFNVK